MVTLTTYVSLEDICALLRKRAADLTTDIRWEARTMYELVADRLPEWIRESNGAVRHVLLDSTPRTVVPCPRKDSSPHYPHHWGDPEDPTDNRWCPGGQKPYCRACNLEADSRRFGAHSAGLSDRTLQHTCERAPATVYTPNPQ